MLSCGLKQVEVCDKKVPRSVVKQSQCMTRNVY